MELCCVVLDIGGVLEMTPATGWEGAWERRLGLPPGAVHERLGDVWEAGSVGTVGESGVRARVAADLGLDPVQTEAFMADLWDEYLGSPNEELIDYVRTLASRCRLGILSNSFVGAREREEKRYGFGALVHDIVYSHEIGILKPAAGAFELTCARLGVRPADCLFIDDVVVNVTAARAVGIRGLLFESNAETIGAVERHLTPARGGPGRGDRSEPGADRTGRDLAQPGG
ncbi:HAD family hydrolase [Streptomyces sp. NPDC056237]|uniref:HAD family hydrolase n=1 Tax=unclassified Streptomyces TaxID=2593676 RepID=UPI0035E03E15